MDVYVCVCIYYFMVTLSEEQCLVNSVYSMMSVVQIISFLYNMRKVKLERGINRRERERGNERCR
jgi:hypothetical protein